MVKIHFRFLENICFMLRNNLDEEGQDAGGLLREWYVIISREIFNPMYALFTVSPGDRVTYMINPSSHANSNHLFYFKFVGRVIGMYRRQFPLSQ